MNAETAKPAVWREEIYPLIFPVTVEGSVITELRFREPDGEMLEAIDEIGMSEGRNPSMRQTNALISVMSGQPIEVIRKMNKRDITEAAGVLGPLLADDEATST